MNQTPLITLPEAMTEPVRWMIAGSLAYATYLIIWCPCPTPVGCKQPQFYTATLLPVLATFVLNTKV